MRYMLDANTCIAIIKRRPAKTMRKLSSVPVGAIGVSAIVLAELRYGVERSARRGENEEALEEFLYYAVALDWPGEAAGIYGKIRAKLAKKGRMIGAMDLLIAAHALHLGSVLVTDNVREFRRVPGLRVENWTA